MGVTTGAAPPGVKKRDAFSARPFVATLIVAFALAGLALLKRDGARSLPHDESLWRRSELAPTGGRTR